MTKLTLVSNSKNNIDLVLESKKTGDPVTEITIQKFIDASKYTSLLINEENIKNAVAELNDVLKPLQEDQTGREIRYEILERLDATITITITMIVRMIIISTASTRRGSTRWAPPEAAPLLIC